MPEIAATEAAFAALAARLQAGLPDMPVDRNRESETAAEEAPCLVCHDGEMAILRGEGAGAYGLTLYRMQWTVAGYLAVEGDEAALAYAVGHLRAQVVRAVVCGEAAQPTALLLADNATEIWPEEVASVTTRAAIEQSALPLAAFVVTFEFDLRVAEGNPFLTTP
ncbi:hypothetical protein [Falsiroseomonas selenitidurans]|uniref:Uncharacterized protein n=1 Tax=Falsiroseomonas selenitidurans TaxID=2716335 RepID=A0ABX1E9N6_9PROT|nr:hypothetical protein [Falsiroseomonas selenitidurans]NKC33495.1 hypothetical protein [Falsiroseomonas selenitidurans]